MSNDKQRCHSFVKKSKQRCKNKCKYGNFCGIHYKMSRLSQSNLKLLPEYTDNDIKSIIRIQKTIRKFLVINNIINRGLCCYARHLCNNKADFLKFTKIEDIGVYDFFSFKDNNLYWGFDILSLKMLITKNMNNPYTTMSICDTVKEKFKNLIKKLEKTKTLELNKFKSENKFILIQQECIRIFQLMDSLKNYTKCKWFLDLNLIELKELYKQLEDIWNYRLNLSNSDRLLYTTDGKLFNISVQKFYKINNIYTAQKELLSVFKILVSDGKHESDRSTASQWILSALTLVHEDARSSLPWLYQSASIL